MSEAGRTACWRRGRAGKGESTEWGGGGVGCWAGFLKDSEMERDRDHKVRNPERDSMGKSQARRGRSEKKTEEVGQGEGGLQANTCGNRNDVTGLEPQFQLAVWSVQVSSPPWLPHQ